METPKALNVLRISLEIQLGLVANQYVAFAVHTLQYDIENNPQYLSKELSLESIGSELAPAVDELLSREGGIVLLGSPDTGRSTISRTFPRLTTFAKLGGFEEVALASGCKYFWTDNVGAWWLTAPFNKRVLYTNLSRVRFRALPFPDGSIFLPVRFQTPSGHDLVFSELFRFSTSPYKLVSRGELQMVRNSPAEICEAHREMIARVDGYWVETDRDRELQERVSRINGKYPGSHQLQLASVFLNKYPHLLE
jgi:putative glycosyltransferase (TIGR04372 family)